MGYSIDYHKEASTTAEGPSGWPGWYSRAHSQEAKVGLWLQVLEEGEKYEFLFNDGIKDRIDVADDLW